MARRLQVLAAKGGVTLYDDFAHHPTAIAATLGALRELAGRERVIAVLEPGSNTMRMGVHADSLAGSVAQADRLFVWQRSDLAFDPGQVFAPLGERLEVWDSVDCLAKRLLGALQNGDHVVLLSNGSFGGLNDQLVAGIDRR